MATKNFTTEEFETLADGEGIILVDFWADWCMPCHRFSPVFERVSEKHPDITFGKVDTEAEPAIAMEFGIQALPTVMAIRDGIVVYQQSGALPEAMLEKIITAVRDLDMNEVRERAA